MHFYLALAHSFWKKHLQKGAVIVDATLGNGKDLLFLATHLLPCEKTLIYGLDIQSQALKNTDQLLKKSLPFPYEKNIQLLLQSHENFSFVSTCHLFIYNLGYLPGSDKKITTQKETSLKSLEKALPLLSAKGAISIMLYPGHLEGKEEKKGVLSFCEKLCPKTYQVSHHSSLQNPEAPSLLWVERR